MSMPKASIHVVQKKYIQKKCHACQISVLNKSSELGVKETRKRKTRTKSPLDNHRTITSLLQTTKVLKVLKSVTFL